MSFASGHPISHPHLIVGTVTPTHLHHPHTPLTPPDTTLITPRHPGPCLHQRDVGVECEVPVDAQREVPTARVGTRTRGKSIGQYGQVHVPI